MPLPAQTRRAARHLLGTVAGWTVAVFVGVWAIAETPLDSDHFVESVLAGALAGGGDFLLERAGVFRRLGRRLRPLALVLARTAGYAVFIAAVTFAYLLAMSALHAPTYSGRRGPPILSDPAFREFLLGGEFLTLLLLLLGASFVINAVREVQRMLGPGVLTRLLLGTYLRPTEEERVFAFIDLDGSTGLAERLGPAAFAELKNDFFYALAEPVLETEGEVAGYVGDEAMLTWRRAAGLRDANWLRCFLLLHEGIGREAERFRARYGTVPSFKAGAHVGAVVTAQVGDLKRELAYSGDAVNTAARIEGACRELGLPLLASDALVRATPLPDAVRAVPVGAVSLRGKGAPVELWSLEPGVTARA